MSARVPVSVIVPIKNEAGNLPRCLDSIRWADEIFVVDSQSTDGSVEIAQQRGAQVVQFQFNGTWPKKKNWALENLPFRNEWVFILDADEVLPPEAEQEFAKAIAEAGETAGYWINRRFMFMGKWLRHSYYPNWNLRLFRHSLGRYEKLTEADTRSGDNEVHEHVIVITLSRALRSLSRNIIATRTGRRAFPRIDSWPGAVRKSAAARSSGAGSSNSFRNACRSGRSCVFFTFTSGRKVFSMGARAITSRGSTRSTNCFRWPRPTN